LKAISFIINTNLYIAFAAVCLTVASQVQLGMHPQLQAYLAVIFFASLLDYNAHRLITVGSMPEAFRSEKYQWSATHLPLLKMMLVFAAGGLAGTLLLTGIKILFVLAPLAILSMLYSLTVSGKLKRNFRLHKIPFLKTFLIAIVWTSATVLLPGMLSDHSPGIYQVLLVAIERFTFIFAIAIPFDIRDIKTDSLSGINTVPVALGEKKANQISNGTLLLSMAIAVFHYQQQNLVFIIPAYLFSAAATLIFMNSHKLKKLPLYHHGILDGCLLLYGLLISISFFFQLN